MSPGQTFFGKPCVRSLVKLALPVELFQLETGSPRSGRNLAWRNTSWARHSHPAPREMRPRKHFKRTHATDPKALTPEPVRRPTSVSAWNEKQEPQSTQTANEKPATLCQTDKTMCLLEPKEHALFSRQSFNLWASNLCGPP